MRKIMSSSWILIFLLCFLTAIAIAHQDSHEILRSKELLISDNNDEHARKLTEEMSLVVVGKGQKGKGAYGGANVVHRRPGDKSAAAAAADLYNNNSFFILSAIFNLALTKFFLHCS